MKKTILMTVALTLLACLVLALPAFAAEVADSCSAGTNAEWTLDDEGTLTITGTNGSVTKKFNDPEIRKLVIEDGVTSISYGAFSGCTGLKELTSNAD